MSITPNPLDPSIHLQQSNDKSQNEIIRKILMQQRKSIIKQENSTLFFSTCKQKFAQTRKFVENLYFQIFITIFTVASLFMEDIRVIGISSQYDNVVDGINITFIVIFMMEICLSLSIPGYACSFFFYLDIVSTLSIVMDVSMLTNLLYANNLVTSGLKLSVIIRNSKASRAAARTVRIMKIFRLARIVKLYKSAIKTNQLKSKRNRQTINQKLRSLKLKKIKQAEKDLENKSSYRNISSQGGSKNELVSGNQLSIKEIEQNIENLKKLQPENKIDQFYQNENQSSVNFKTENEKKSTQKQSDSLDDRQREPTQSQSKISKLLSQNTMKKIIIMILLIMFSVPILQIDNYYQDTSAWDFLASFVAAALPNSQISIGKINQMIEKNVKDIINSAATDQQIVMFTTPFQQLYSYDSGTFNKLRFNDLMISEISLNVTKILQNRNNSLTLTYKQGQIQKTAVTIILSCRPFNQLDSWFSIVTILFICFIIIYLLNTFNSSITMLVTQPIEKMLEDMKQHGKTDQIEIEENKEEEGSQKKINNNVVSNYETERVQQALNKISGLISKIFGAKGKELIYKKIFDKGTVMSNYLSQNKRVYCIIGLCSIVNYHAISEILKANILELNNQIAHYLHSAVYRYGGSGVMNYQDSFLVVFQCPQGYQNFILEESYKRKTKPKLCSNLYQEKNVRYTAVMSSKPKRKMISDVKYRKATKLRSNKSIKLMNGKVVQNQQNNYLNVFTDFAVFAMVKTLVKINKESKFYKYRKLPSLAKGLQENFQIKLNCMLHAGWVEQGFLGTSFKMDYCYFGEPINQLRKMAYYCHTLPNSLFISDNVYNLITPGMRRYTRIVGNYQDDMKQKQTCLHIIDLNLQNISLSKNVGKNDYNDQDISSVTVKKLLNFQCLKDQEQISKYRAATFISVKKQLREVLRNVISQEYRKKYLQAYEHYINEQYVQSKQILDELSSYNREDSLVFRLIHLIELAQKDNQKTEMTRNEELEWLTW